MTGKTEGRPRWPYPGARWWKFDFHMHTPASNDYGKGPDPAVRNITPTEWLLGFMRAEVDCVAVTDHNSGAWIDKLKAALANMESEEARGYRPLHLFPGVELSVNGGFHLLAIFRPDAAGSDIDTLLGAVDYDGTKGKSDGVTTRSAVEVVEAVLDAGGIPIPAHADQQKGLLRLKKSNGGWSTEIDPNTVAQVLESEGILAMETIDPGCAKPGIYQHRKLEWTEVLGSDSHHLDDGTRNRFPGSHFTWVKMSSPPSLEGLRLALLDGRGFSIRRSDEGPFDPFTVPKLCIESIEIGKARYMGRAEPATLHFSPWLNAIVGGRGTGKSTVIHALRLGARRERDILSLEENSIPRSTFESFNRVASSRLDDGALTDETSIRWTALRDGIRHRVTWRRGGSVLKVEDQTRNGDWVTSPSQSVTPQRFPVRIFSQGQIAELAGGSRPALLPLIDEAAGASALSARLSEARNGFLASRARIRELEGKLERHDDLAVELQDVERKLRRLEGSDHAAVLRAYRRRARQQTEANRQFEWIDNAARSIDALVTELQPEDLPEGLLDDSSGADRRYRDVVEALGAAVDSTAQDLKRSAEGLREASANQRQILSGGLWQVAADDAAAKYEELISQLRSAGVSDPSEYGLLVQERQRLRGAMENLKSKEEERQRRLAESAERLREVLEARRAISDARDEFLSGALAHNDFVRISIRRYGDDARAIERSLRKVLDVLDNQNRFESDILTSANGRPKTGIVATLFRGLPTGVSERGVEMERRLEKIKNRLESACRGGRAFGGHFNNYLQREFERDPAFLDRLWAWFPEDGLSVEYSRTGDGKDFRPIGQASAGQRSAAMLAFLLAHGAEPLVLDQPEDDLDNHLIYDLVVRQIRANKLRRQIIVVTHNPNIVVNGDAEMLHAMEFAARQGQCVIAESGSLQERAIREEVCRVMEGGREAFRSRYRRLGTESPGV